ncbi:MAG: BACON domain-containing carbohydrate-binding protein [Bacteroidota bacterium]|nr:BACON domain-containing carbohydrate-binding protein [Bacteroidota bacterium]
MKRLIIIIIAVFLYGTGRSQYNADSSIQDTTHFPYWIFMMQDPDVNFHAARHAFELYWSGRKDYKSNGWRIFKRWEYIMQDQAGPDGKLPSWGSIKDDYNHWRQVNAPFSQSGNWSQCGPMSVPANATNQPNGLGRINAICIHPVIPGTIYAGSPSGGLWKTTNGGSSWNALAGDIPTLGVSSILINPVNSNIVWIGTGDRDASDAPGMGVYKSVDGGNAWEASNSGMGNVTVGMMLIHPSNPDILLAATSSGIYKSTDGGLTWNKKSFNSSNYKDIRFNPGDPSIVYATEGGRFYRSVNTGDSWTQVTSGVISGTRMVIGVSPAQPSWVYLIQTSGIFSGCMKSTDNGQNFVTQSTTPNIMDNTCSGTGVCGQSYYDLCISVDPADASILYTGGINIWKSTNGGVSWSIVTHWIGSSFGTSCAPSVHADIHTLERSSDGKLYAGCDAGISYSANNGTTWTDLSNGLGIAQVYKIGQSATSMNLVMSGYQDNGTTCMSGSSFTTFISGDGMECMVDYSDTNFRYGENNYGTIFRTSGAGYSSIAGNGINGITECGAWVTPYILHNTSPSVMFAGYINVWKCSNVKSAAPVWIRISSGESVNCNVLEQSPADPDILYVSRGSVLKRTDNANDQNPSWIPCTSPASCNITALKAHPSNPDIVYVSAGSKIYKSTDKGMTWSNISGSLPSSVINTIVYDKNSNEGIYIGNKTGVFYKDATMPDWISFSNGLPSIDVRELEIYYDANNVTNNRIKAATYGRGLWQSDLYGIAPTLSVVPQNQNVPATPGGYVNFTVTSNSPWTVSGNASWCTVTPSGNGNGIITATYSENTYLSQRVATITVTVTGLPPATVTVTQSGAAPELSVSPQNQSVPSQPAGSTFFIVTSNTVWNASSNQSWCTIPRVESGSDSLVIEYEENTTLDTRVADITVSSAGAPPVIVTVTQPGVAPLLTVSPSNQDVMAQPPGSTTFDVVSNTGWTVSCAENWCSVTPEGTGNGIIYANYGENSFNSPRVAYIYISVNGLNPVMVTLTQSGAVPTLSITPEVREIPKESGNTFFFINSNTNWNANTDQPWCLVNPVAGSGNDTLHVYYEENPGSNTRSATILITPSGLPPSTVSLIQEAAILSTENKWMDKIRIYPNPSRGEFYIVFPGNMNTMMDISIRNPEGQRILEKIVDTKDNKGQFDLSNAAPGTYFLMMKNTEEVSVRKLVLIR